MTTFDTVVSYWISTSNHNREACEKRYPGLYLIEFLHQTTTLYNTKTKYESCILLNFYIKPQPAPPWPVSIHCCILLNFYIKPQLSEKPSWKLVSCILLNFYIKPQRILNNLSILCVVSYWISTSNHNLIFSTGNGHSVVSYWISTSNHNLQATGYSQLWVVSYWISTSNHN